ncbi:hypothetical protein [Sphingobacterium psychroaquaticum]|uniref:Uncharacterized protein n=1 Tax=Sphingobacterium psychroaquaticum TaxID=561061 RepID=A0A1X7JNN1_9SPHI|nr:hypothetical protein [Sphingobacterium psychroaquaticum]QBQ40906.1 hypothetical protein E2P86_06985 [Sphingobacterium psychroaquaticum]SMG29711.1 hypothetical protein SAMN05660862_1972 [Sphingobacterium psychroaquaticum]
MKKVFLSLMTITAVAVGLNEAKAQTPFKSALGVVFDGSDGANVGIQYKTALKSTTAAQFQAAFGDNWISVGGDWQYEKLIPGAEGLAWYAGVGAQLGFVTSKHVDDKVFIGLRPQIGLEYKIPTIPFGLHLDYKPYLGLNNDSGFNGDGFTFGIKYILK